MNNRISTLSLNVTALILFACSNIDDDLPISAEDIINLEVVSDTVGLKADGVTQITLEATIPAEASNREITFETTEGRFISSGENPKMTKVYATPDSGKAEVIMVISQYPGTNYVSASVDANQVSVMKKLISKPALPEKIALELSASRSKTESGSNISVNVFLTRENGSVSVGRNVEFEAFQLMDNQERKTVGRFQTNGNTSSNSDGKITVQYFTDTDDIDANKPIHISASTLTEGGTIEVSSAKLILEILKDSN